MKRIFVFILLFSGLIFSQSNLYFLSTPSPSPDGKNIVFTYQEDLWIVPAEGGKAYRLTGMQGIETNAVYSPDGKWIAFNGSQDVYYQRIGDTWWLFYTGMRDEPALGYHLAQGDGLYFAGIQSLHSFPNFS